MSKLTWGNLRYIYEGTYGVTADEANVWISKELFGKNWFGTPQKVGRMWQDIEICIAFTEFLIAVDKFKKKNNYTETAAIIVMHEQRHRAVRLFGMSAKHGMFGMSANRFRNLCSQWKRQLRESGFMKPKQMSEYTRKSLTAAQKRNEKKIAKAKLLIKRSVKK
jgi:hypothetical protein|tara:strand:+ start:294 stop:785 length:492 start_codon:yes stop_codon:yes gene_type:complete